MTTLMKYPTIIIVCSILLLSKIDAQENRLARRLTYTFEFVKVSKSDTLPTLFCVLRAVDLLEFTKVNISYNNKTDVYTTHSVFKEKSAKIKKTGNYVYFKIDEILNEPFVIVEGINKAGKKTIIHVRNERGDVIDPKTEKARWKKDTDRIDSMDYVRKFDNVYKGKDGKPRFRGKDGKVYIIERSRIRSEK